MNEVGVCRRYARVGSPTILECPFVGYLLTGSKVVHIRVMVPPQGFPLACSSLESVAGCKNQLGRLRYRTILFECFGCRPPLATGCTANEFWGRAPGGLQVSSRTSEHGKFLLLQASKLINETNFKRQRLTPRKCTLKTTHSPLSNTRPI